MDATVTLPDGRLAVVHTDYVAVGYPVDDEERAALGRTAGRNFRVLVAAVGCATARATDPSVVTEVQADGWTWAYANVLCTLPVCRTEAEEREAEHDETLPGSEHPAAPRLRAWAHGQADELRAVSS